MSGTRFFLFTHPTVRLLQLVTVLALAMVGLQAVEIVTGPVAEPSPTNVVIRWTTDHASGSRVRLGVSKNKLDARAGAGISAEHRVVISDLKPGTRYYYSVGTARVPLATNSFTTPGLADHREPRPAQDPARRESIAAPATADTSGAGTTPPLTAPPTRKTWGHIASLQDHFDRHGSDFGARTPDDYAAQAWLFLQRARVEGLPAKRDETGVLRVFDAQTGAFAAYNRDGTTKTYFKPGRRSYFADQPGKPEDLRNTP